MQPTVKSFIFSLLRDSTTPKVATQKKINKAVETVPFYPTDLFFVSASLLDAAGAFGHFDPDPDSVSIADGYPRFTLLPEARLILEDLGKKWRSPNTTETPHAVVGRWANFLREHGSKRVRETQRFTTAPDWWTDCHALMIISDEACEGIGSPSSEQQPLFKSFIHQKKVLSRKSTSDPLEEEDFDISSGSSPTFSINTNSNFGNVFPKTRVSTSGCSHRNFSRNLTLLPKTGSVRCHWHMPSEPLADDNEKPIDILIIPFPYNISAKCFVDRHDPKTSMEEDNEVRSGWANFEINQRWLKEADDLKGLFRSLLRSARDDVESVNGVVFPEYSLTFDLFLEICQELKAIERNLEFVVAGASNNCDSRDKPNGNHVLTCVWHKLDENGEDIMVVDAGEPRNDSALFFSEEQEKQSRAILSSRRKHHRWMLTPQQLTQYAVTSSLDPRVNWWEAHNIGQRELHFFPFRRRSTFTSMICEDLARSDPCHEVLRSVGPNLVFVLLMDGPQIASRWSARYASSLSDDPGCSVLTVTSLGLIERSNRTREHPKQEAVAFFASPFGQTPLLLPSDGAKGILITLTGESEPNRSTIDGRADASSRAWKLTSSQPIYLKEEEKKEAPSGLAI